MGKLSENTIRNINGTSNVEYHRVKRLCTEKVTPQNMEAKPATRPGSRGAETKCKVSARSTPSRLKRSTSLIAITPKSVGGESSISRISCEGVDVDEPFSKQELLIWKVLYSFNKNVCKKRKNKILSLASQLEKSEETSSKLNIQVSLLKSVIRSDETIRETWKKRLQDVKEILTASLSENNRLKQDFEEMTLNVAKLKEKIFKLETENNNYKNTDMLLRSECAAFEEQLKKERESNSLLRYEHKLQMKALNKDLETKLQENDMLKDKAEDLEMELVDKSFALTDLETNLQNTRRLLQNAINEVQLLDKEAAELRRANKLQRDEMVSVKKSMTLLETNQQEIYKYFNMNIE